MDEYQAVALSIGADGVATARHLAGGETLGTLRLVPEDEKVTASAFEALPGLLGLGTASGKVSLGKVSFDAELLSPEEAGEEGKGLAIGRSKVGTKTEDRKLGSVLQRVSETQYRRVTPMIEMVPPTEIGEGTGAIHAMDYRETAGREFMVAIKTDGTAVLDVVTTVRPLGGGQARTQLTAYPIPFSAPQGRGLPERLFITGDGQSVLAMWSDGLIQRYRSANPEERPVVFAEEWQALPAGRKVTAVAMQLGGLTLILGDDAGFVSRGFAAVDVAAKTPDGQRLVSAGSEKVSNSAIRWIGTSIRDRCIAVADADGQVGVLHATSGKWVVPMADRGDGQLAAVAIAPKVDGLAFLTRAGGLGYATLDKGYPEASVKSLFGKVHYEGTTAPQFVYQSSSGEDSAEVKYSLVPLIHGTLKATAFAMVIAIPLGVLAAIYTSEFLSKRTRRVVKPTIEMMASLPSVVLGFLASIVIAPFVTEHLSAVLLVFLTLPIGMLAGGYLWQLIPRAVVRKVPPIAKLLSMAGVFGMSVASAWLVGPAVEHTFFKPSAEDRWVAAGSVTPATAEEIPSWVGSRATMSSSDRRELRREGLYFVDKAVVKPKAPAAELPPVEGSIRGWLDGGFGSAVPGWFLLLTGPGIIGASLAVRVVLGRTLDDIVDASTPLGAALIELGRFVVVVAVGLGLSYVAATVLNSLGIDARDSLMGEYSQRNTLVVGMVMGFAIIPIIYTISEDAMAAVPSSLRSASLGAGATPWQTAVRVVMPVAASGIFSAIMIGLGRAVGETMIVVMATGNTADMSWNMFSGCRTLSANIATELPEAGRGDVHFRVLFLCGLVLFVMTFALNTTAELIRQRFRKRSAAL
jgi:phosphate transport system permease protein